MKLEMLKKHRKCFGWIMSSLLFLSIFLIYHQRKVYFDCSAYWKMSGAFITETGFCINPERAGDMFRIRGYVFPFILFLMKGFGKLGWEGFWITASIMYGFFFSFVCGNFFENLLHKEISAIQRIIPSVCVILFWRGLVLYPLTDLMAIGLEITALYLLHELKRSYSLEGKMSDRIILILLSIVAGALLYAAYNTRPIYQYCIYLVIVLVFVEKKEKIRENIVKNIIIIVGIIVGISLVAVPQVKINQKNLNISSWKVPLQLNTMYGDTGVLLYQGLELARYETNVMEDVESPSMYSYDSTATAILHQMPAERTVGNYMKIWIKYPLECIGIYWGHLINALDVRYSDIYISDVSETNYFCTIASLALLFIVMLLTKQRIDDRSICYTKIRDKGIWLFVWLVPSMLALLNDIEPRYVIGIWIMVYSIIAFAGDYQRLIKDLKKHPIVSAGLFLILVAMCFQVWDTTYANMTYADLIFKR